MDLIYEAYRLVKEALTKNYGHTLWVDPKGKVIDITGAPMTHYSWLAKKYNQDQNSVWGYAAREGWIQVRNHPISLSFMGPKKFLKKNRKTIYDIVDNRLFNSVNFDDDGFLVDFVFVDENGDPENRRHTFKMPDDDGKLRRFL